MVKDLLNLLSVNDNASACRENLSYIMRTLAMDLNGISWLSQSNNDRIVKNLLYSLSAKDNS